MPKLLDISEIITDNGYKKLKKGQILMFQQEGSPINLKIVRLNKRLKRCLAEEVTLYKPSEVRIVEKDKDGQ